MWFGHPLSRASNIQPLMLEAKFSAKLGTPRSQSRTSRRCTLQEHHGCSADLQNTPLHRVAPCCTSGLQLVPRCVKNEIHNILTTLGPQTKKLKLGEGWSLVIACHRLSSLVCWGQPGCLGRHSSRMVPWVGICREAIQDQKTKTRTPIME